MSRSRLFKVACLLGLAAVFGSSGWARVTDPRVDNSVAPICVDRSHPAFSWRIESDERGYRQGAYRILVASSAARLADGTADLWDSGKVASAAQTAIPYAGRELASSARYFWKVDVFAAGHEDGEWSELAPFETALLRPGDWTPQWIASKGARLYRKRFELSKPVARARVYVSALGLFELHLNGAKVGNRTLEPIQTNPTIRLLYETFDVTRELTSGSNALAAMVGGGPYARLYNGAPTALLVQLRVDFTDGSSMTVASDATWKASPDGPITKDELYVGENYDARKEIAGWDAGGFDDAGWSAVETKPITQRLAAQRYALREMEQVKPVAITQPAPGRYIFDLGKIISGRAQLRVDGPAGAAVSMRYGEVLRPDGTLNTATTGRENKAVYTLKGGGPEVWAPRFFTTSFRFVEVTGYPGEPSLDAIRGLFVQADIPAVGQFACSNPVINGIEQMYALSQEGNLSMGIPTDCPGRERLGWLGDALITAPAALVHWDMSNLYEKWFDDFDDDAAKYGPSGSFHSFIPWPDPWNTPRGDPPWASGMVAIPWDAYLAYGDLGVLARHYPEMVRIITNIDALAKDDLVMENLWGDWVSTYDKNNCNVGLLSSGYYYRSLATLVEIASLLGRVDEAARYARRAAQVRDAINAKWLVDGDHYDSGSQTANALALDFDLVPRAARPAVWQSLLRDLARQNYHVTTGVLGTYNLMGVLWKYGRNDLAYRILSQVSYPSLGYMTAHGATTPWEHWWQSEGGMDSLNHVFLAGPAAAWFMRGLAGLSTLTPGYGEILVAPAMVGDLTWASGSIETGRGTAAVRWTRDAGKAEIEVTIPPNASATVKVPTLGVQSEQVGVWEGATPIWADGAAVSAPGVTWLGPEAGSLNFKVGSGHYRFTVSVNAGVAPHALLPAALSTADGPLIPARSASDRFNAVDQGKDAIGQLNDTSWLKYSGIDLSGKGRFLVCVALDNKAAGKAVEIRLDDPNGPVIGRLLLAGTGGKTKFHFQEGPLTAATAGAHDIFVAFRGGNDPCYISGLKFADGAAPPP